MPSEPEHSRLHFEVERELAARLRSSTREQRRTLVGELYGELFRRVPDHPRLRRRDDADATAEAVRNQMRLLAPHLRPGHRMVEIAPGDGRLARAVAERVGEVVTLDISDQRGAAAEGPANLRALVFDGFDAPLPDGWADIAFSYQFLEHLHPDDVDDHFRLVARILKPGGIYVLDTPHRHSGPWDASRSYSDEPVCFHLQEWTFREVAERFRRAGFRAWHPYRFGVVRRAAPWRWATLLAETLLEPLPRPLRRRLAARAFRSVTILGVR